ncbi:hypothetical protein EV651_101571 [Kribbella sp. VKM Ac-2571]|uniref:hypothetical protein n=1 Tax=Kribbella sp. VKM Ac-2571 TaxID=2512222 RepID=UPI00105D5B7E|nr:hypothetical protein [Kribbella sp. VKM Ac-2571]TDO69527.1 hypothetical protein EV651_101571 [Kribbella sp. VKM Ac-2571]
MADDSIRTPYLTVQERPARNMAARLGGTLAVDGATNCIVVLKADQPIEVAWPPGCSVAPRGVSFAVLDPDGRTIAELGDTVMLGGGYVLPPVAHTTSRTGSTMVFAVAGRHGLPT